MDIDDARLIPPTILGQIQIRRSMASRMQVYGGAEIRIGDQIPHHIIRTVELALPAHLRHEYKAVFNKHTRHLKASGTYGEGDCLGRMDQNKHRRLSHISMHLGLEILATRVRQGTLVKNINRWYDKNGDRGLTILFNKTWAEKGAPVYRDR